MNPCPGARHTHKSRALRPDARQTLTLRARPTLARVPNNRARALVQIEEADLSISLPAETLRSAEQGELQYALMYC